MPLRRLLQREVADYVAQVAEENYFGQRREPAAAVRGALGIRRGEEGMGSRIRQAE